MTDEQFDAFVAQTYNEMQKKQDKLIREQGLGTYKSFWFNQLTSTLQFKDEADIIKVEALVTPIGTFSHKSNTWQWVWANPSFVEPLRLKAERLKQLKELTGFDIFEMPMISADEQMAWELTAMSVQLLDALGCYRAPSNMTSLFVAIHQLDFKN